MLHRVVYRLPLTHPPSPGEGSAQAGPRHGEARETRVLKAPWDLGTSMGGGQKASQSSSGPGELAQGFEGPGMGQAGSGLRSVLANPISGPHSGQPGLAAGGLR